jgi:DNA-directed RNA polymerase subunit RPC12/RpoP
LLEAYGIGPHTRSIIEAVWDLELAVPRSSDCYGNPFHPTRGVRQGDIISPVIFNIVIDAVIREWDIQVCKAQLTDLAIFFYADDGRIDGKDDGMVQEGLNIVVDLFRRMGLQMNSTKTKAMIHFRAGLPRALRPEAYARIFDKSLPSARERRRQQVQCPECSLSLARNSLTRHLHQIHHLPMLQIPPAPEFHPSQTYHVDFPVDHYVAHCPVADCPAHCTTKYKLRRHFAVRHPEDVIIIVQEGEYPRCPYCRMFVPKLGPRHFATKACQTQSARVQEKERIDRQANMARNVVFYVDGTPIDNVTEYKYLGRIMSADDQDTAAVSFNIKKASKAWFQMYHILSRQTADPRVMARFYLAVVQAKLLYGAETWVLSQSLLRRLESFHARCARTLAHRPIHRNADGTWEHPHTDEVLERCGLSPISTYIAKRKTRLLESYATTESQLYTICIESTPIGSGSHRQMWWT